MGEAKYSEHYCKLNNLTYEAPLKIKVRLTNKELDQVKEQEIFLADFSLMTDHGTFIINGVERVVVPQLARSFGVFFTANDIKGKRYFGAKVIPSRGAWIEIETEADGVIYARIDRKRKIPVTSLLRIFGAKSEKEIEKAFEKKDNGETAFIKKTLEKDTAKSLEDAYIEIYSRLRPGEPSNFESAKNYFDSIFGPARYDISRVGRYRLNHRLGLSLKDIDSAPRVVTLSDLFDIISEIIRLNNTPNAQPDDIDHLGNRRVRTVAELLQNQFRVGLSRIERSARERMNVYDKETMMPHHLDRKSVV